MLKPGLKSSVIPWNLIFIWTLCNVLSLFLSSWQIIIYPIFTCRWPDIDMRASVYWLRGDNTTGSTIQTCWTLQNTNTANYKVSIFPAKIALNMYLILQQQKCWFCIEYGALVLLLTKFVPYSTAPFVPIYKTTK